MLIQMFLQYNILQDMYHALPKRFGEKNIIETSAVVVPRDSLGLADSLKEKVFCLYFVIMNQKSNPPAPLCGCNHNVIALVKTIISGLILY